MEFAERFGKNPRRIREGAGLSQEALGLRCSLHRTEIGLLERGERVPRVDTLVKIAGGLGVRVDSPLFDGIDWTPGKTQAGAFVLASSQETA
jgi:transcriptional regulator with XRE-family HTH domain